MVWIVVYICAKVMRTEMWLENRIDGCFVVIKCKRVLTANNVKETGKVKILQSTNNVWTVEQGHLW